jgi:hypothetical protein
VLPPYLTPDARDLAKKVGLPLAEGHAPYLFSQALLATLYVFPSIPGSWGSPCHPCLCGVLGSERIHTLGFKTLSPGLSYSLGSKS